ncbi:MAG: hypothetical protein K0Q66_2057 [Chitinophagaceae bacterium]|jgi:hypothetical protein|nr:hypothetical protein [Chitinophagaceae bacterium]
MGLSIHYQGKIRSCELISPLCEELKDICSGLGWKWTFIDDPRLSGVVFSPQNCERVFFIFNTEGVLVSLVEPDNIPGVISVKTQYAGIDAHIALIKLIRHLSEKYFREFDLDDEGRFWETGNVKVLEETFRRYEAHLTNVTQILKNLPAKPDETAESLADRIEAALKKGLTNTDL